ncbi:MAG: hypothetical protein ACI9TH_002398 [Kiritimatiellia bacterium]|jgi:hypothetical protein
MNQPSILVCFACLAISFAHAEPKLEGQVALAADATSGMDAYTQIQRVFGKRSIESPDRYPGNHTGFEHIRVEEDSEVGGYFRFYLHRDLDGDRHEGRAASDRQRNEIKGYTGSDAVLKARRGQVSRYRWKFRIGEDMGVTTHFCHFFQLKGVGGDDADDPLLTLSGAVSKGKPLLELRHWPGEGAPAKKFSIADWSAVKDQWLQCACLVRYGDKGSIRFSISTLDGTRIYVKEIAEVDTWRAGMEFVRPKWGVYRSLEEGEAIENETDVVCFTDFIVQEWSELPETLWIEQDGGGQAGTRPESK